MSEPMLEGGHLSEFVGGYHGTCGETALAVAMAAANGVTATSQNILDITAGMRAAGLAADNGAATLAGLATYAKSRGYSVELEQDYQADNFPGVDWQGLLASYAGAQPMVVQLANGQALSDAATGAHDEAGLQYHFIAVLGKQAGGIYVCADGDNPQAPTGYEHYTVTDLASAQPCALLVLRVRRQTMAIPAGWSDDGATLKAPNGVAFTEGFRAWLLANPGWVAAAGSPLSAPVATAVVGLDPAHGPGAEVLFQFGGLMWTEATGVQPLWVGAMAQSLASQLATAQAQLGDAAKAVQLAADLKAFLS